MISLWSLVFLKQNRYVPISWERDTSNELIFVIYDEDAAEVWREKYEISYFSRHTSAASSSHQTGTSLLDTSSSQLTDTYLFSFKRTSDRKDIISWSPGNLMVSASPAHHIHGIWAKVLRYIWKDKQVNTPRFRLKIVTSSNVLACSLSWAWLVSLLRNWAGKFFFSQNFFPGWRNYNAFWG